MKAKLIVNPVSGPTPHRFLTGINRQLETHRCWIRHHHSRGRCHTGRGRGGTRRLDHICSVAVGTDTERGAEWRRAPRHGLSQVTSGDPARHGNDFATALAFRQTSLRRSRRSWKATSRLRTSLHEQSVFLNVSAGGFIAEVFQTRSTRNSKRSPANWRTDWGRAGRVSPMSGGRAARPRRVRGATPAATAQNHAPLPSTLASTPLPSALAVVGAVG